jgi:hypothetical protein
MAQVGAARRDVSRTKVNTKTGDRQESKARRPFLLTVVVLTAPLWLAALVVLVIGRVIQVVALYAFVWLWWIGWARRRVLFVYSDSPNWKECRGEDPAEASGERGGVELLQPRAVATIQCAGHVV